MPYTILSRQVLSKIKGKDENKIKYKIVDDKGNAYCAIKWSDIQCIVYDDRFDDDVSKFNWIFHKGSGFAYSNIKNECVYMHKYVLNLAEIEEDMYHIDNKLDNRLCNFTKQKEKNVTRNDKKKPIQELMDEGITELPRFLRWDKTETKFVIENHPFLLYEVEQNLRKKSTMSCTKRKMPIIEKYNKAVETLKELDAKFYTEDELKIIQENRAITNEYTEICKCIDSYKNLFLYEKKLLLLYRDLFGWYNFLI